MFVWSLVGWSVTRFLHYAVFLSGGVMRLRIRLAQRLLMDRFNVYLAGKPMLQEERNYDEKNTLVYYSWEEGKNPKGAFTIPSRARTHTQHALHTHFFCLRCPHLCLSLPLLSVEYGYSLPRVTVEYDRATGFMLGITIEYNRRLAKRNQALTGAEVRNKVCENMLAAGIFEDKAFTFKEEVVFATTEDIKIDEKV